MSKSVINTRRMIFLALMAALYVALNVLSPEAPVIRVSMLCFLPVAVTGMLLGPVFSAIVAVLGDVLSCLVKGYAPYIPLTVTAALAGAWYGIVLHEKPTHWLRALMSVLPVILVVELGLNTIALSMLRHQPLWTVFVQRVWSNLIEIPIKTLLLMALLPAIRCMPKQYLKL